MPYDVKGILCCKITKKKQYIIISTLKKVQKDFTTPKTKSIYINVGRFKFIALIINKLGGI